ncbi:fam-g protein [Plasmodium gallinaceum]|uniref:Fam-g protein n=1 Tax=Plasmodium gallinaceum TaxID=5849 RepID=A0A1J1GYD5_PLAGA|nr:fam-g protein [Plasmodium gallinaceum]CRG96016.1 fam-g protein [Plasmodium gallinaceum]
MKTLILFLKITTFLLLIWMYLFFYNCDSYKNLIDKNILQTKNELKYERVLTEGDTAGQKQTNCEGCKEECPVEKKKKEKKKKYRYIPLVRQNPYDRWQTVNNPTLFERFKNETIGMDDKWRDQKWNNEWNKISANKVNELSSIFNQSDISKKEKEKLIYTVKDELFGLFANFLKECKKEIRDNKAEYESKKEMIGNKTESEYMKEMGENGRQSESMNEMIDNKAKSESENEMRDNKMESESEKEMRDNKAECESEKEMRDNRTESESIKEMIDNRTESESIKEMIDNRTETESMKEMIENKAESESEKEMRYDKTESESRKEMRDNKEESESEEEMRYDKTESESRKEQGTNEIKNYKKKIRELLIVLIILRRI